MGHQNYFTLRIPIGLQKEIHLTERDLLAFCCWSYKGFIFFFKVSSGAMQATNKKMEIHDEVPASRRNLLK